MKQSKQKLIDAIHQSPKRQTKTRGWRRFWLIATPIALFIVFSGLALASSASEIFLKIQPYADPLRLFWQPEPRFKWGAITSPFALKEPTEDFTEEHAQKLVRLIDNLGANATFTGYVIDYANPRGTDINDQIVQTFLDSKTVLVIGVGEGHVYPPNYYQNAYDLGYQVAARYKGKISYYHLLNEVNGFPLKPGHHGLSMNDYYPERYQEVRTILQGLADGIHAADPEAKRIVSANWRGTAIIDQLIKDGVQFEIVGWHWYSDSGQSIGQHRLDDDSILNIPKHFTDQGKEFWITEANITNGSADVSEAEQAEWLKTLAGEAISSPDITGFFVYTLVDGPIRDAFGLFPLIQHGDPQVRDAGLPKKAFLVLKQLFQDAGLSL